MKLKKNENLRFIMDLFRPYKRRILLIFATILISAGITMMLPLITKMIMDDSRELIKKQRSLIRNSIRMNLFQEGNFILDGILFQLISACAYLLGGFLIFNGILTIGKLFAFLTYMTYVTGPIAYIMHMSLQLARIFPAVNRYRDLLRAETERSVLLARTSFEPAEGLSLAIKDLSFAYPAGGKVLEGVSFTIAAGEKVAILGSNGSGKTTLLNLLLRFAEPQSGSISINGVDIRMIPLAVYRSMLAVVSQAPYLFNSTIKDNLSLAAPCMKGEALDTAVHEVMELCGVSAFTHKSKLTGVDGSCFSGGEKQKIALARAMLRDAPILLLDEATSQYDLKSEAVLNRFLMEKLQQKAILVVSHRPEILQYVDRILVLEKGTIRLQGEHRELLQQDRYYQELIKVLWERIILISCPWTWWIIDIHLPGSRDPREGKNRI